MDMKIASDITVGEVVKMNFRTASFFQSYHIDYCCGGKQLLTDACNNAGVLVEDALKQLTLLLEQQDSDTLYIQNLQPDELADYIVKRHHAYVRTNIPVILQNLLKICEKHGEHHPELYEINEMFNTAAGNLSMHMQKEEMILFPYIRKLSEAKRGSGEYHQPPFETVSNPIEMMISEHQQEGDRFDMISKLSGNYNVPSDACMTYEVTMNQLREFEEDLHHHIHLENNILFPEVVALEREFVS